MKHNIREEIVAARKTRIAATGFDEGAVLPERRTAPIVPFLDRNGLICEVKRRSPSKGDIAPGLDAVEQAERYLRAGAANLSILTVPEGFGGSLTDLVRVKQQFPEAAVLRKDFLIDVRDVETAWRAGADAVLLIAGMLSAEELRAMHARAKELGMAALVEIHDREDTAKARSFRPDLVGINSRDLTTFRIDPLLPLKVRAGIDWDARVVYESGVNSAEQASFAISAGFSGLLVGEGVVRDPGLAEQLLRAMADAKPRRYWREIGRRLADATTPLTKICGLTREEDARLAADLGADALGFVFWPKSPRRAAPDLLRSIADLQTLKVAVVVGTADADALDPSVSALLDEGLLDAVQFHGDEPPDACVRLWPEYYKALRPGKTADLAAADAYRCPRILLDAFSSIPGGSGKRIADDILSAWDRPLWLAGGINPDNAAAIVSAWRPELVDVASGVEEAPGEKSAALLRKLFDELRRGGEKS